MICEFIIKIILFHHSSFSFIKQILKQKYWRFAGLKIIVPADQL